MQSKHILILFCMTVLAAMGWVTVRASLDRSVVDAAVELVRDPWFLATLFDAYFAFLTFYLWVFYKESTWVARVAWLIAILLLGNFAMAVYVLRELARLAPGQPVSAILLRKTT